MGNCCGAVSGLKIFAGGESPHNPYGPVTTNHILEHTGVLKGLPDNNGLVPSDKYKWVCGRHGEGGKMGQGAFGSVRMARGQDKEVAIKKLYKKDLKASADGTNCKQIYKDWVNEVDISACMDHPNIVKLHETFEDQKCVYMVMEVCRGGDLFDTIVKARNLGEKDVACLMMQMLQALTYMHDNCVAHRDLKPDNFMIVEKDKPLQENILKLIDFGLAKRYDPKRTLPLRTLAGTPYYMAPEVNRKTYNEKCDVWSAGVILYIMLSGTPPFNGDNAAIFKQARKGLEAATCFRRSPEEKETWDAVSKDAKDLILQLMQVDESKRLSAKAALARDWVQKPALVIRSEISLPQNLSSKLKQFSESSKFRKAALHVIAKRYDDVKMKSLRDAFVHFDKDGDGQIDMKEMEDALRHTGKTDMKNAQQIFNQLDTDRSGSIGYTEFLAALLPRSHMSDEVLKEAFRIFDKDNNGQISLNELTAMLEISDLEEHNETGAQLLSSDVVAEMFHEVDTDKSGGISLEEFTAMMRCGQGSSTRYFDPLDA